MMATFIFSDLKRHSGEEAERQTDRGGESIGLKDINCSIQKQGFWSPCSLTTPLFRIKNRLFKLRVMRKHICKETNK